MSFMRIAQIGGIVVAVGGGVGGVFHAQHITASPRAARSHSRKTVHARRTASTPAWSRRSGDPSFRTTSAPSAGSGSSHRLPANPVGGEGGVSSFPYDPGVPVARFVATSPVRPGQTVHFLNESYDTSPGVSITTLHWVGRASAYRTIGVHPVTLVVRDSLGRVSAPDTVDVVVTNPPPPTDIPVAYFVVTSPVAAGSRVNYTNESYDPRGEPLVNQIWHGRASAFSVPGTYPVTLRVVNASGNWSAPFTRDIVVTAAPRETVPTPSGARASSTTAANGSGEGSYPTQPSWSASVTPNPASRGQIVTITVSSSQGSAVARPILDVPSPFTGSWGGISYASANASGPMTGIDAGTFQRTLTVPQSPTFPVGRYVLRVTIPGQSIIPVALTVTSGGQSPPETFEEPIVSGN